MKTMDRHEEKKKVKAPHSQYSVHNMAEIR
jgi:hypothetical protein